MSVVKIKNRTPHDINILDDHGNALVTIPKTGAIRVDTFTETVDTVIYDDIAIPVTRTIFGRSSATPEKEEGVIHIVSTIVAQGHPERSDFFIVSESKRVGSTVVGCKSLARNPWADLFNYIPTPKK